MYYFQSVLQELGKGVRIEKGVQVYMPHNVSIGDNSFLGTDSLYAFDRIELGSNVLIAPEVLMITRNHKYSNVDKTIKEQGYTYAPIDIQDDVWVGFRAIILPGICIESGAIVAAGAVVTRDVSGHTIVGGIPARVIGER
jgi:maltose O-acetyltransferase